MQVVTHPLPGLDLFHCQARVAVRQRRKEVPAANDGGQNHTGSDPRGEHALLSESFSDAQRSLVARQLTSLLVLTIYNGIVRRGRVIAHDGIDVEDELQHGAGHQARCEVGRQVVMQEELPTHEIERQVVRRPAEEEEAGGVV